MTASLIERVESAAEGSRELDREIMALHYVWDQRHIGATCWDDYHGTCCPEAKHLDWVWVDPTDGAWKTNAKDGYEFTTSLDAALALAERLFPCWAWSVGQNVHHKHWLAYALVLGEDRSPIQPVSAVAKSPALALCAAILKAHEASK